MGVKAWGMAPWGRRNSPVPRHTQQNRPEIKRPTERNPTTGEENTFWLFIIRPTNAQMWHKADFKVGPVTGPKPTRLRQGKKYLRPRQHSPFQRKITSDYLTHVQTTHEDGTRPFSRWVRSQGRSQHASGKARNTFDPVNIPLFKGKYLLIIYHTSHQRTNGAQGRF